MIENPELSAMIIGSVSICLITILAECLSNYKQSVRFSCFFLFYYDSVIVAYNNYYCDSAFQVI